MFSTRSQCNKCGGTGKVIKHKCKKCHGEGRIKNNVTYEIEIPSGIDNGDVVRQRNPRQDMPLLYVHVRVKPHNVFKRQNDDLIIDKKIPFTVAALGGKIDVPTIEGEAEIRIPPGIEPESILKMNGKGIRNARTGSKGDQYIRILIEVPKSLSRDQKRLIEELNKTIR